MRALLPLILLTASCASSIDYATGRATLNAYTVADDIELGTKMATLLIASSEALGVRTDPDDIYTRTVRTVAARILAVPENRARMPPVPWEVHVVGAADADAWCFSGGQLLVSTGLLQSGLVRDEDELATIMGHEMAHAAARHGTERRTIEEMRARIAPLGAFFGPRLVELANPKTPRDVIAALVEDESTFDREQEIEADIIGLEMMARAGYAADKAARVWARIAEQRGAGAGLGATHPAFAARAAQISRHLWTVRYLERRRTSLPPENDNTGWTWSKDQLGVSLPRTSMPAEGWLPSGVRASDWMEAPELLEVHVSRTSLTVAAARDLYEDRLPISVRISIEPDGYERTLVDTEPLTAASLELALDLPALKSEASIVRVRAAVGALYGEATSEREPDRRGVRIERGQPQRHAEKVAAHVVK